MVINLFVIGRWMHGNGTNLGRPVRHCARAACECVADVQIKKGGADGLMGICNAVANMFYLYT